MFCPKCGFNNFNGVEICGGCGARLGNGGTAPKMKSGYQGGSPQANYRGQNAYNYPQNYGNPNGKVPGKGTAVASLVLGIVSVVFWFFGVFAFIGLVTGIVGIICSSSSKKAGYVGGMRTAGFVLSLIGTIGAGLVFVACLACATMAGGLASGLSGYY